MATLLNGGIHRLPFHGQTVMIVYTYDLSVHYSGDGPPPKVWTAYTNERPDYLRVGATPEEALALLREAWESPDWCSDCAKQRASK